VCEQLAQGRYPRARGRESNPRPSESQVQRFNHYAPGHTTTLCRFVIWRGAGVHSVACEVVLTCEFCAISVLLLLLLLHPFNGLFSRTTWVNRFQKGKTSIDLNEARVDGVLGWQWHQLDHMQTISTSLQTDNHTNTSSLNFYRPDAVLDAQPTVSKHWRQFCTVPVLSTISSW